MKFFVEDRDREFFQKNGLFLVEDVFSEEEIELIRLGAETQVLSGSMKDLALSKGKVQEVLFSKKLAQIAFALAGEITLRYGYDMFFRLSEPPMQLSTAVDPLVIGACIALESGEDSSLPEVAPFTLRNEDLPRAKGSVLFFSPKVSLSFSPLSRKTGNRSFLLLLYAGAQAQYLYHPEDPHTHDLKRIGYVFGDRLKGESHPFLYQ